MTAEQKFLGTTARLYIKRTSKFGVYLGAEDYPEFEVLLPGGQVPPDARRGDYMEVFLYKDSERLPLSPSPTSPASAHFWTGGSPKICFSPLRSRLQKSMSATRFWPPSM